MAHVNYPIFLNISETYVNKLICAILCVFVPVTLGYKYFIFHSGYYISHLCRPLFLFMLAVFLQMPYCTSVVELNTVIFMNSHHEFDMASLYTMYELT